MHEESLKNKTVKGVGWSAVDNVAQYAVTFVVGIVLARLLSPDDDNRRPCHSAADMGNVKNLMPSWAVLTIFAVCTILDRLRLKAVEEPLLGWWDRRKSVNLEKS